MKISVIGQGYVGATLAIGAARVGHTVFGIDTDPLKIKELEIGSTTIPGLVKNEILELIKRKNYVPTLNPEVIKESQIVVIAVPTPLNDEREPDMSFLESACSTIAQYAREDILIVNESTSYPGTIRHFIYSKISSLTQKNFLYASAPERIDPGNTNWTLENTPRVIGGLTQAAEKVAIEFYSTFCNSIFRVSSPEAAEASKLFENTFRQVNIALVNEFSKIAHKLDFSTHEAIRAASTKPFGYMPFYPSIGVGGHCIPVDPTYLSYAANKFGFNAQFINLSNRTNLEMIQFVSDRLEEKMNGNLRNLRIQLAGIAYKIDIDDLRESPALLLLKELKNRGSLVSWHDPIIGSKFPGGSEKLSIDIDLGLIVTPHSAINFSPWQGSRIQVLDLSPTTKDYGWPKFL
jgi:UDP-N-acetyl-D-glucosamine dehydrogenase